MRGPQRGASPTLVALARCKKIALVGVQARDLLCLFGYQSALVRPQACRREFTVALQNCNNQPLLLLSRPRTRRPRVLSRGKQGNGSQLTRGEVSP